MEKMYSAKFIMICTTAVLLISNLAFPQTDTLWTRTAGGADDDYGYSVEECSDGGFIVAGSTASFSVGSSDVYLIKYDAQGNVLWTKTYGGYNWESSTSVQQTSDGGYILGGTTTSFGAGISDAWLLKTDASGDTLWTRTYGGPEPDGCAAVRQTDDDGYILVGSTRTYGAGWSDLYLVKTDASGDTLWTRVYGGTNDDYGYSVQQSLDGGYIVAGVTSSFGGGDRTWLIKTDASGDTLWTRIYSTTERNNFLSVQQTSDQGYIIGGSIWSGGATTFDVSLIKTNSSGDTLWTKAYGGADDEFGHSIQQTIDGGYIITGMTSSFGAGNDDVYLIKTDASGDTLWTKTFGGPFFEDGSCVRQTSDGGYIIAGETTSYGAGWDDLWLIRLAGPVGVEENIPSIPSSFSLLQNYPNPFNPSTKIKYAIGSKQFASLKVYDVLGNEVATLVNEEKPAGTYEVGFNAEGLPSGVYFYQLHASAFVQTKKMLLLK